MFPFTPLRTYIARSVPVIEAAVLNAWQLYMVDIALRVVRQRPSCYLHSHDGAAVQLEYLRGTFVVDSVTGQWVAVEVPEPATTLTVGNLVPAAGSFAASTWYYIYLRAASRIASFVISTVAPSTDRFFGADNSYRYLGCFLTNSSAEVTPFHERDGRFFFTGGQLPDLAFDPFVIDTTWTNIGTLVLPPGIRRAIVRCTIENSNTAAGETLSLLPHGISGTVVSPGSYGRQLTCPKAPSMGQNAQVDARLELELAPSYPQLEAKLANGGGLSAAVMALDGFEDWS